MEKVIDRLRQTKAACEEFFYHDGKTEGRRWAQMDATYYDLKRLGDYFECLPLLEEAEETLFDPVASRFTGAQLLYAVIDGDNEPDCEASEIFWRGVLSDHCVKAEQPDFLRGFVEGSLSIWDEVIDQI
jgi:hypothetical protein